MKPNLTFGQKNLEFKTGFVEPMFTEGNFQKVKKRCTLLCQPIANHLIILILSICKSSTGKYRKKHPDTNNIVRASSLRSFFLEEDIYISNLHEIHLY